MTVFRKKNQLFLSVTVRRILISCLNVRLFSCLSSFPLSRLPKTFLYLFFFGKVHHCFSTATNWQDSLFNCWTVLRKKKNNDAGAPCIMCPPRQSIACPRQQLPGCIHVDGTLLCLASPCLVSHIRVNRQLVSLLPMSIHHKTLMGYLKS